MVATTKGPRNSPNPQEAGDRKPQKESASDKRLMKALDLSDEEWGNLMSFAAHQGTTPEGAIKFALNQTIGQPATAVAHESSGDPVDSQMKPAVESD